MQTYTVTVFDKGGGHNELRLVGPEQEPLGSRPLDHDALKRFVVEVEGAYLAPSPNLVAIGRRLCEWIDGPTQRWLERIVDSAPGLVLRIDVSTQLRHLPWELMYGEGGFLFANAFRPATPIRHVKGPELSGDVANRPLRVLFMASSPENERRMLDFEAEEAKILDATVKVPVDLVVEESGTLDGLKRRLIEAGPSHYDILHITGHADVVGDKPLFVLEDDVGQRMDADSEALALACVRHWPRLVFLSGCKTGQAVDQGELPSLCEALIQKGAPAVLGWALPVGDPSATKAAARLYQELAEGTSIVEAVAAARQVLFDENSPYWHRLRLYARPGVLPSVVTSLMHPGREQLHRREAAHEFLDTRQEIGVPVPVCPRASFVGRRRLIQRCLRTLRSRQREEAYAEGVLLQGMGGLGKSSLAARLCERMAEHERLVWWGRVEESDLLRGMARLGKVQVNEKLNEAKLGLRQRLVNALRGPLSTQRLLFVFDDFEHNLSEAADGSSVVQPGALDVLTALLGAIRDTASESRVIVTSRLAFPLPRPLQLETGEREGDCC